MIHAAGLPWRSSLPQITDFGGTMRDSKRVMPQYSRFKAAAPLPIFASPRGKGHSGRMEKRGRHRKPQLVGKMRSEHGKRLVSFSLIGFVVFAAGLGLQVLLVQVADVPKVSAYVIQLVLSVQINFLANYRWTWGGRDSPFWRSCWRYNIKRAAGTLLNLGLYPMLVHFGMNYLAANTLLVVALTPGELSCLVISGPSRLTAARLGQGCR